MPASRNNRGISLVELLIALLLLELAATATLHGVLLVQRQRRATLAHIRTDHARLAAIRDASADPTCLQSPVTDYRTLVLPPAVGRDALTVLVRCGEDRKSVV